ncbi:MULTISPECIES: NusG domain II-containing protein [Loigolactobacillus]|uniref:Uncharacterized protein n=1 Tax=Loigolactobacillus backii TaxID=375175 RepID=A0A192H6C9_9LACO|nr:MULTISPECIES: NusG domain II-containing protein [Loigolactobacillus]ANK60886.1 hypothetical protein AYR52_01680 [Loigolactobacillus backii]ANK63551.1 hypothetical protein AYR53_06600 [Loigolactobacillus backii]ANK65839.1 hypothetical protein AYR54_01670 [Loigolactobacillus backii]ANK68369.1 hypothetical protein AYR55_07370 [Loigolactobacillus backii]ANK70957.1 hypothetical protein AYR56_10390 [Loigolactobacillus backii]
MLRPWDIIIIVFLIILSFTPLAIFSIHERNTAAANIPVKTAVVSHDGKQIYKLKLTNHRGTTTYTYRAANGDYNKIVFKNDKVAITDANCSDQICVKRGWISKSGQTIVCLPHKLLVEIKTNQGSTTQGGLVTE